MPVFRAVIERVKVSHELIEFRDETVGNALITVHRYLQGNRHGVSVVRPHDADPKVSQEDRCTQITER